MESTELQTPRGVVTVHKVGHSEASQGLSGQTGIPIPGSELYRAELGGSVTLFWGRPGFLELASEEQINLLPAEVK